MRTLLNFLVLLDFDSPETFNTFCFVSSRSMVVSFMRVDFVYSKGEKGHWEELERIFGSVAVCNFRKERILLAGFCVRR